MSEGGLGRGRGICNRRFNWITNMDKKVHNVLSLTFKIM